VRKNIFRDHKQRVLAAKSAERGDPVDAASANTRRADGLGGIVPANSGDNAAALMLVKLTSDRARLREIQSVERKIDAKREMLVEYQSWLDGLIEASESLARNTRNDVLTTCMMWHIDCGDFARALHLGAVVVDRAIPMPSWFERTAPCALAEQIAEAAFQSIREKADFDIDHISLAMLITDEQDMPDEVRAKLHKAQAMLFDRSADGLLAAGGAGADAPAGAYAATLEAALAAATRALQLNSQCRVKTLIRKTEAAQKKLQAATAPAQAA
jgi:Phage small terminase subunit